MTRHWAERAADVAHTLDRRRWKDRKTGQDGLRIFDLGPVEPMKKEKRA